MRPELILSRLSACGDRPRSRKRVPTEGRSWDKISAVPMKRRRPSPATPCMPRAPCRNCNFATYMRPEDRSEAPRCTQRQCRGAPSFGRYLPWPRILCGSKRSSRSPCGPSVPRRPPFGRRVFDLAQINPVFFHVVELPNGSLIGARSRIDAPQIMRIPFVVRSLGSPASPHQRYAKVVSSGKDANFARPRPRHRRRCRLSRLT